MLQLESNIEGKYTEFGKIQNAIKDAGFTLGGYWDYDRGIFDAILSKDQGETIYLRLPFIVTQGMLDSPNAYIRFETPYVIKHIANLGLEHDGSSMMDATGFSQFQEPIDKDGSIEDKNKWISVGEQVIEEKVLPYLN
ncbi:YugN family protein [Lysinibacillus endophyticus]|uniref:YugN family protein n=1 Tax=Ureibacillus endophyticus TaxID=1978490 RepID=UPI00209ED50C|nr:YugN family protein [Lysinibacillus endophyticus]MCP1143351.1 YugN-like family protein [Lysinibacillus endophyticus]